MKREFIDYLTSLGLTEVLVQRVSKLYEILEHITKEKNEEIEDIFVSEYIDKEGIRHYTTLWFFTKNYFLLCQNFVEMQQISITYSFKSIRNISMNMIGYDFVKSNKKSRLIVKYVKTFPNSSGDFSASEENVDYLKKIYIKWLLPNIL